MSDIIIDPVFKSLIPPLSAEEARQLEANLKAENGARDPLVVWRETGILIDGHHRHSICSRLGLGYKVAYLSFPDRDAAADWICVNQVGRRNIGPEQASRLRGIVATNAKKRVGAQPGNQNRADKFNGATVAPLNRTSEQVAEQFGVSRRTIANDVKFATAVDDLKAVDPNIEQKVMTGDIPSMKAVVNAAKVAEKEPEKAKAILRGEKPGPAPAEPEKPWSEFEAKIREEMKVLRGVASRLRDAMQLDSESNTLQNPWARGYSYAGAIAGLNQYIRLLEDGLPVADATEPGGWTTAHRQEIKERSRAA